MKKVIYILILVICIISFTACKDNKDNLDEKETEEPVIELSTLEKFEANLNDPSKGYDIKMSMNIRGINIHINAQGKDNLFHIDSYNIRDITSVPEMYIEVLEDGYYMYEKNNGRWSYTFEKDPVDIMTDPMAFSSEDFDVNNRGVYVLKMESLQKYGCADCTIVVNEECNGGTINIAQFEPVTFNLIKVEAVITENSEVNIILPVNRDK